MQQWYLYQIVAQNVLRTCKGIFFQICYCFCSKKCLKQNKSTILLHMCAPISELPSYISTLYEISIYIIYGNANMNYGYSGS